MHAPHTDRNGLIPPPDTMTESISATSATSAVQLAGDLRVRGVRALRGRNLWSPDPVVACEVVMGELSVTSPADVPGFADRLRAMHRDLSVVLQAVDLGAHAHRRAPFVQGALQGSHRRFLEEGQQARGGEVLIVAACGHWQVSEQ